MQWHMSRDRTAADSFQYILTWHTPLFKYASFFMDLAISLQPSPCFAHVPGLLRNHWDPGSVHTLQRCRPSATQTGGRWRSCRSWCGDYAGRRQARTKPPKWTTSWFRCTPWSTFLLPLALYLYISFFPQDQWGSGTYQHIKQVHFSHTCLLWAKANRRWFAVDLLFFPPDYDSFFFMTSKFLHLI